MTCVTEVAYALKNIDSWAKPTAKKVPLVHMPSVAQTLPYVLLLATACSQRAYLTIYLLGALEGWF